MRNRNRRPNRRPPARRGSVLILVVALLVLLALMGTAYLSSTSTERGTSVQNAINVEGDLQLDGLAAASRAAVADGAFGLSPVNGIAYRPAQQDMPTYDGTGQYLPPGIRSGVTIAAGQPGYPTPTAYAGCDSVATDSFLGNRVPAVDYTTTVPTAPLAVSWGPPSLPLVSNPDGSVTIVSPMEGTSAKFPAAFRPYIRLYPTTKTVNGVVYPGAVLYQSAIPAAIATANPNYPSAAGFITPAGFMSSGAAPVSPFTPAANTVFVAADTDGDGIADAVYFAMPGGPVGGVTYYGAYRITDNASAVNVSTAWTSATDYMADGKTTVPNYGFFRSNIGLLELLNQRTDLPGGSTPADEINSLNFARFNNGSTGTPSVAGPMADPSGATRSDLTWFSAGDALDNQLARRANNPAYSAGGGASRYTWLGAAESATLAYHFSLQNGKAGPTLLEQDLYRDLLGANGQTTINPAIHSAPYGPADTYAWFTNQFDYAAQIVKSTSPGPNPFTNDMPLRALLTGTGAASNAALTHPGDAQAPAAWSAKLATSPIYAFGDTVVITDTADANYNRTYTCILQHTYTSAIHPGTPGGAPFWAAEPITKQVVKTSANTATFEQLYLAYARVMTDSVGENPARGGGPVPDLAHPNPPKKQWLPPMQATVQTAPAEQQMPMFRSPVRLTTVGTYTGRLLPSQVLQLRAGLAAVNTVDLRDSDDSVTSRRITLVNPDDGTPQYEAELFGTEAQPFIGGVYAHVDATTPANNFLAIQLVNPYDHDIILDPVNGGWKLGSVLRGGGTSFKLIDQTGPTAWTQAIVVPAKSVLTGAPGIAVLQSAKPPTPGYTAPIAQVNAVTVTTIPNLQALLGAGEVYFLKPRVTDVTMLSGRPTATSRKSSRNSVTATSPFAESYDEGANLYDLVPVDQVDLTNLNAVRNAGDQTADFYYRRGSDPTHLAGWNCVYPGPYTGPTAAAAGTAGPLPQGFGTATTPPDPSSPVRMDVPFGYNAVAAAAGGTTPTGAAAHVQSDKLGNTPQTVTGGGATQVPPPTFDTYPIELNNTQMGGPNKLAYTGWYSPTMPATATFPYGGFAREVDLLQVPFIGAYRLRAVDGTGKVVSPDQFIEMNSVSEDSSLAISPSDTGTFDHDGGIHGYPDDVVTDPAREQIGRFCPIGAPAADAVVGDPGAATPIPSSPAVIAYDLSEPDVTNAYIRWHYHWARRLFDYLTVHAPADDYLPNIDPAGPDTDVAVLPGSSSLPAKDPSYSGATSGNPSTQIPTPVPNRSPSVYNSFYAGSSDDTVGVEGQVNINTAPWPVIAAVLPILGDNISYTQVPNTTGTSGKAADNIDDRINLAKAIVDDRTYHGPFRCITDLYRVPAFRLENDALLATEPRGAQGVFSPTGITDVIVGTLIPTGRPRYDFQERFLLLNRISNLITVRSDTFTAYVQVVGYRDVGVAGATPTLAVQRRAAYLLDRNTVTPVSREVNRYPIPNE